MPSKPEKVIMSEQDPSLLNSPGVITRSQLKRLSLAKGDSVRTCLDFEDKADTNVDKQRNEVTPTQAKKGRKRNELLDTIDEGSSRKSRKLQDTDKKSTKPEKGKTPRKSISSSVKKSAKNSATSEPEVDQEDVSSAKKKTAKGSKKKKKNESESDTMSLVEKLLADVRKDLDSESTMFDDSSLQTSNKVKVEKSEVESTKGSNSNPEILQNLVPKIEKESPVKKKDSPVPEMKKEEPPLKANEKAAKPARMSLEGNAEDLGAKENPQVRNTGKKRTSIPPSTDPEKEVADDLDVKPSKVANLNKSLEISDILSSNKKEKQVSDSSDTKLSKAASLNKSLEMSNILHIEPKSEEVSDSSEVKASKVVKSPEISNIAASGSKASEVSETMDVKQKKVGNLNKSLGISPLPKDGDKVKVKETDRPPISAVDQVKNGDVPVTDHVLKPLVKFSPSPQKATPWSHSAAQTSWQSIKLADGSSESDSDAESRKAIKESAQRRIEQNLSTSESESRFLQRIQPCLSDSDSAPDCVSFQAGKRAASESLKNAVQSIQRDKQRRKEKRKARLEMLKQQKEEKLIRLKEKLASQVDASCSSSEESGYEEEALKLYKYKKQLPAKGKASVEKENCVISSEPKKSFPSVEVAGDCLLQPGKEVPQNNLKSLPLDVLDKLPEKVYPKDLKADEALSKVKKRKKEEDDGFRDGVKGASSFKIPLTATHFIPLKSSGATKFGVVALDKLEMAPKPISSLAADFKQSMFNRHKREPVKVIMAHQQKLQAAGKNVFTSRKKL